MAKQNNKPAEGKTTVPALTADNVMDEVKNGNLIKDSNVERALEEIKKKEDERQVQECTNMIMCAKYVTAKELIGLRARRREANITKDTLKKSDDVLEEVLAGKITPTEYKKKKGEILKEKEKAFRESSDEYDENMRELRNSYTGEYRYMAEWDRY